VRLDGERGAVELGPGSVVQRGTPANELQRGGSTSERFGNGFGREQLELVEDGVAWSVTVAIGPDERARMIDLAMYEPGEGRGWEHWSLEVELARRDRHDAWLALQLGPGWVTDRWEAASTGSGAWFTWGAVVSDYDQRSGCSAIRIDWRPADERG
jgi:hypothetical protein